MRVRELWIYPFKSCRGVRVGEARVVRRGLERDRRWMVVDAEGRFLTQRTAPEMAKLACALEGDTLRVRADGADDLVVPAAIDAGPRARVVVWKDEVDAIVHAEASAWFSARLARACRAVYMPDDALRPTKHRAHDDEVVSFADAYPLLALGQASLDALSARVGAPVSVERFRPNVVVEGAPAHDEDAWERGAIGAVPFRTGGACVRCSIPSIDPETAAITKEPLATLATYRKADGAITFGVNLAHEGEGAVRVGDEVRVLARL